MSHFLEVSIRPEGLARKVSPATNPRRPAREPEAPGTFSPAEGHAAVRLRILSFNIQTGIATSRYRQYLTQSWKHVLPCRRRLPNLDRIAGVLGGYDLVGLQEVDAGSLRSDFVNQTEYLAGQAGFPFWHHQTNRRLGRIAQHSLGLLSRVPPEEIGGQRLPGRIPGRGVLVARFGSGPHRLLVVVVHLALGKAARLRQAAFIGDLAGDFRHAIVMGDFNFRPGSEEMKVLLGKTNLSEPLPEMVTFPSWRPHKGIDHILVSPSLRAEKVRVLDFPFSDHLPVAAEVVVPGSVGLGRPGRGKVKG